MTLTELIPAISTLTRVERESLVQYLQAKARAEDESGDEIAHEQQQTPEEVLPEMIRHMLTFTDAIAHPGYQMTTDAEGYKVLESLFSKIETAKS